MDELKQRLMDRLHLSSDDMARFDYDLQQAGTVALPLEAIIPRFRLRMKTTLRRRLIITPTR
jgi:hypothetical protein